jgi:outer membrane protein assembly factor BamB
VYAVRIDTCELIWSQPAELGGAIVAPPLIIGGNLYVGSFDRSFYALDLDNGSVSAPLFSAESWFWAGAATDGTRIYVPNLDGTLYAYDLSRQALAWSYDQEGGRERIISAPVVVGNNIVLASDSGVITLLDSNMNTLRRLGNGDNDVRAPLTAADGIVFAHSLDEMIIAYAVDRNGLDNVWELKLPGF